MPPSVPLGVGLGRVPMVNGGCGVYCCAPTGPKPSGLNPPEASLAPAVKADTIPLQHATKVLLVAKTTSTWHEARARHINVTCVRMEQ
jgi:hypothetical protein